MYLSYGVGIFAGPLSGRLSNRIGNGATMALGSVLFAAAIGATFIPSLPVIAVSLPLVCGGFFSIHAAAAGSLNRNLGSGRGRANSLYVLFYYLGGSLGITAARPVDPSVATRAAGVPLPSARHVTHTRRNRAG